MIILIMMVLSVQNMFAATGVSLEIEKTASVLEQNQSPIKYEKDMLPGENWLDEARKNFFLLAQERLQEHGKDMEDTVIIGDKQEVTIKELFDATKIDTTSRKVSDQFFAFIGTVIKVSHVLALVSITHILRELNGKNLKVQYRSFKDSAEACKAFYKEHEGFFNYCKGLAVSDASLLRMRSKNLLRLNMHKVFDEIIPRSPMLISKHLAEIRKDHRDSLCSRGERQRLMTCMESLKNQYRYRLVIVDHIRSSSQVCCSKLLAQGIYPFIVPSASLEFGPEALFPEQSQWLLSQLQFLQSKKTDASEDTAHCFCFPIAWIMRKFESNNDDYVGDDASSFVFVYAR